MSRKVKLEHPLLGKITVRVPKSGGDEAVKVEIERLIGKHQAKLEFDALTPEELARMQAEMRARGRRALMRLTGILGIVGV